MCRGAARHRPAIWYACTSARTVGIRPGLEYLARLLLGAEALPEDSVHVSLRRELGGGRILPTQMPQRSTLARAANRQIDRRRAPQRVLVRHDHGWRTSQATGVVVDRAGDVSDADGEMEALHGTSSFVS